MQIRPATLNDADAISALIKSVAQAFTLHPNGHGAESFLQGMEPAGMAGWWRCGRTGISTTCLSARPGRGAA